MPETAVDEYRFAARAKDQIRFAWKVFSMKPVSIPHSMNKAADHHLGLHVFRPDTAHIPTSPFLRDLVGHA